MATVSPSGSQPVQPATGSVHGAHQPNAKLEGRGASVEGPAFSAVLAQTAVSPSGGGHSAHAGMAGGSQGGGSSHFLQRGNSTNASNASAHPGHIPLGGSSHRSGHSFQELALGLRAYRQQLIASNIANADTPGYQAVDIDFQEAIRLAQSLSRNTPVTLKTTSVGHIPGAASGAQAPFPLKYIQPTQGSIDGNTVDMDIERAKFAENSMMYEFSLDRVGGHFKHMKELLQELKT